MVSGVIDLRPFVDCLIFAFLGCFASSLANNTIAP
jgi:hypothetical protein